MGLAAELSCLQFSATVAKVNEAGQRLGQDGIKIEMDDSSPEVLGTICWRPEIGFVRIGLNSAWTDQENWSWLHGHTALAAFMAGLLPTVNLKIVSERPTIVAGHCFVEQEVIVEGTDRQLSVRNGSGDLLASFEQYETEGIPPVWVRDLKTDLIRLGSASLCARADAGWASTLGTYEHARLLTEDKDLYAQFRRQIEAAANVMELHLPEYYVWAVAVLREAAVMRSDEAGIGGTSSSSFLFCPGQIHFSAPATLIQTIGMLVHECSHQYFLMTQWSKRVVKKDAPEVYSVLKKTQRPLDKVLLGFHAFANMLLAFDSLESVNDGIDRKELKDQQEETGRVASNLDRELQTHTEDLEDAGKDFYLPLRKRLLDANLLNQ